MPILCTLTELPNIIALESAEASHKPILLHIEHQNQDSTVRIVFDGRPHEQLAESLYRFHGHRADTGVRVSLEIWEGKEAAIEFFDDADDADTDHVPPTTMPTGGLHGH